MNPVHHIAIKDGKVSIPPDIASEIVESARRVKPAADPDDKTKVDAMAQAYGLKSAWHAERIGAILGAIKRGEIPGITTVAAAHAQTQALLDSAYQSGLRDGRSFGYNSEELRQVRDARDQWRRLAENAEITGAQNLKEIARLRGIMSNLQTAAAALAEEVGKP